MRTNSLHSFWLPTANNYLWSICHVFGQRSSKLFCGINALNRKKRDVLITFHSLNDSCCFNEQQIFPSILQKVFQKDGILFKNCQPVVHPLVLLLISSGHCLENNSPIDQILHVRNFSLLFVHLPYLYKNRISYGC